ncbi:hypothetical protein ACHAXN_009499 [Cyclotella atomus]
MMLSCIILMRAMFVSVAFTSLQSKNALSGTPTRDIQVGMSSTGSEHDAIGSSSRVDLSTYGSTQITSDVAQKDESNNHLPHHLVSKLDLDPLLRHVSTYACTRRGKDAILSLLPSPISSPLDLYLNKKNGRPSLFGNKSHKRRDWYLNEGRIVTSKRSEHKMPTFPIAQCASEATQEYNLVYQAMEVLRSQRSSTGRIPLPPMFQLRNVEISTTYTPETDDDEWIDACLSPLPLGSDILEEVDLYMILQAEQVSKLLLNTYEWAISEHVSNCVAILAEVITKPMQQLNDHDRVASEDGDSKAKDVMSSLSQLHETLRGSVETTREGSNSYQFRLSSKNHRFKELTELRQREEDILSRLNKTGTGTKEKAQANKLAMTREEIKILESQIQRSLIAAMTRAAPDVDLAFDALARLDVIFAKAAFGLEWNGVIPEVGEDGKVNVHKFIHPVLAIEKQFETDNGLGPQKIVPIDLLMPGRGSYQALLISGPNSGGKTLALKSFGLAAALVKLALPITLAQVSDDDPVVVDYFRDIFAEIGDNQSLLSGESTLMARLNSLSALIEKSSTAPDSSSSLVLLDELGGGTDPVAGAALAQAILETVLSNLNFKVVATTHSSELKSLALTNEKFKSACVTLDALSSGSDHSTKYNRKPTYQLRYGATGESFALGAASRCRPPLPIDVIERAAQLMSKDDSGDALLNHLEALDREVLAANIARQESEKIQSELSSMKHDTLAKLQSSDMYLSRLENRLEAIFQTLSNDDTKNAYELVGDSLDELKLLRKKVKTEEELLAEKGLRRVPENYSFYNGETVVILAEGEFKGYNGVVKMDESESTEQHAHDFTVTVIPTLDLFSLDEEEEPPLQLKRRDVAIWDYPDTFGYDYPTQTSKSNSSSTKVISLLSTLNVDRKTTKSNESDKRNEAFTSARQRKASRKGKKKK